MLKTGIKNEKTLTVTPENCATNVGSGELNVFATPAMIALMEHTCSSSVKPELSAGETTVGTAVDIKHVAASPVGAVIRCESELAEADGRRLVFRVRAFDECGLIGEGTHERFVVSSEKFMAKLAAKRA